jgi:signal transduction histidine kinase
MFGMVVAFLGYVSMIAISYSLFYFTYYFPIITDKLPKQIHYVVTGTVILTTFIILLPGFVVKSIVISPWRIITTPLLDIAFGVFLVLLISSFVILIRKNFNKKLDGIQKWQVRIILIGTATGSVLGVIFNLLYPLLFNDYTFVRIGPVFILIFIIFVAYAIIRYTLFNIKVIATQSFIFVLWIFIFIRLLVSNSYQEEISNIVLLFLSVIVGMFLIRSVQKEVSQREKIENLAKDLEKANDDLASANDRLKELDQLKSEFLSLATHQIRSPLTAIKGYASLILEGDFGEVSESVRKPINTILSSCENLVVIVNDFLNISRIEQGKMKYDLTDFDIVKVVGEVMSELKPNIESAGLSVDFKSDVPSYVIHADLGKIKQVIGNLIDNSIKYTKEGGISLQVKTDEKETDKIIISISDTGIGIAKEDMTKLFGKFVRAKDAFRTNVVGTGLGLYVAKQMVEAQGGKIWIESPGVGKGSTFFVELPKK